MNVIAIPARIQNTGKISSAKNHFAVPMELALKT
jgi:hypothetical protein